MIVGLGVITFGCAGLAQPATSLTAEEIVSRMVQSEREQEKNLPNFSALRAYHLRNGDGSRTVKVVASVHYRPDGVKRIDVVDESGTGGIFSRVIRKLLDAEVKASGEEGRREMRLSSENYNFRLKGVQSRDGRDNYVLTLLPRRKSKYLIDGTLWVDAQDFAISRIEGRPAASLSFWVGKPYITQTFQKFGKVWLMSSNESVTDAKLLGKVLFSMETREVQSGGSKIAMRREPPAAKAATN